MFIAQTIQVFAPEEQDVYSSALPKTNPAPLGAACKLSRPVHMALLRSAEANKKREAINILLLRSMSPHQDEPYACEPQRTQTWLNQLDN